MQRTCLSAWDHYLISLGGSPAVVSCTCWWVHGPVKQEAKPTDIHLEPTEQSTLICVSLAAFPPRPPLPFPLTARARTRERADAQPIFTKIAALCIWSTRRKLKRVTWTARWHSRLLQCGRGWKTAHTCWDRAVQIRESCSDTLSEKLLLVYTARAHVTDDARKVFRQPMRSPASKWTFSFSSPRRRRLAFS